MSRKRQFTWGFLLAGAVLIAIVWRVLDGNKGLQLRMAANAGDFRRVSALLQKEPGIINSRENRWTDSSATAWTNAAQGYLTPRLLFSKYHLNELSALLDT